jgi:hypothetical protein
MPQIIITTPLTPIQQTAARYTAQANQQWLQVAQLFAGLTKFIYGNPAGPQAAFDAFGTSAADLMTMGNAYSALVTTYTGVAPVSPVPVGSTITANADGTVTYTAAPASA